MLFALMYNQSAFVISARVRSPSTPRTLDNFDDRVTGFAMLFVPVDNSERDVPRVAVVEGERRWAESVVRLAVLLMNDSSMVNGAVSSSVNNVENHSARSG